MNDPRTYEHIGASQLRAFNSKKLKALDHVVIVHDGAQPIRALVPYQQFMQLQEILQIARGGPAEE